MNEGLRLHLALCTVTERLAGVMDGAHFERRDGYALLTFPTFPIPSFNGVWPDEDSAAGALHDALAEVETQGIAVGVLTQSGKTPAVDKAARELGLTTAERIPGMVANAGDLVGPVVSELEVIRVKTADGFAQALAVAAEGFEVPADFLAPLYMLEVTGLHGFEVYLGRAAGRDVTTAASYVVDGDVGIFNVATPSEHRGLGYGATITSHAILEGFAAGADLAYLQSSAIGESVYRRLGFREVVTYVLFTRPAEVSQSS
jgi:ribosomal protein S18 acetylase RimI-like enzyme